MRTVDVAATDLQALAGALDEMSARRLEAGAQRARHLLAGRRVWNVSATERGGVGELLRALLPYAAGAGVDVRWLVVDGDPGYDDLTARLTHAMHGDAGDGGGLGAEEMAHYEQILERNLAEVRDAVSPGDVVILHDPATAGLAAGLRRRGAHVIWRSHVGADVPDEVSERAWTFLEPFLADAERVVLTRAVYRPGFLDRATVRVIAPSIDPLSPKNRPLEPSAVTELLRGAGILDGGSADGPSSASRASSVVAAGGPVPADARVVLQLSRWDRLKDMTGLLIAFDESFEELPPGTHLVLAGAEVDSRDTAGAEVLSRCLQMWEGLEAEVRSCVHVLCLPNITEHNALLVNAVQRLATVVVQKSLAEGFGLTVAEALWKGRPVVATAVGGIQDQITDGENGLLVRDATDLQGLMRHVARLLAEPAFADQLGAAARDRVQREFLSDRHLLQYVDLLAELLS
ncbi:glycosyltransferase [Georgenia subflava]|uniref:Glycosyltransferase n=1 Tax=Georgenia subflava TaxID=1622177 RepID=A0A6N7EFF1_9MICO|nr:glycosyltransferase [Georgenia subflava]MPV36839.1 glycosyltransferase [Georgenia subflava]